MAGFKVGSGVLSLMVGLQIWGWHLECHPEDIGIFGGQQWGASVGCGRGDWGEERWLRRHELVAEFKVKLKKQ